MSSPKPLRVTIAIDGSDNALAAARCWAAWQGDAEAIDLTLLHIAAPLPHAFPVPGAAPGQVEQALLALGERQLEPARTLFASTPLHWRARVEVGPAADAIVAAADPLDTDLLVAGTRGLNPLRGLLVGSVALRLAQSTRVALWLHPPAARCPSALGRALKLLVPVDGSEKAQRAAAWCAQWAPRAGTAAIELLCVQPPFSPLEGLLDAAAGRFDHWSQRVGAAAIDAARSAMGAAGAAAAAHVCTGATVEEIERRAEAIGADAIVLGTRALGAVGQVLLGSVSSALLQIGRHALVIVP